MLLIIFYPQSFLLFLYKHLLGAYLPRTGARMIILNERYYVTSTILSI